MRLRAFVAFVALVAVFAPQDQASSAASGAGIQGDRSPAPVEIIRDQWGIPHVFADTDAGAFYGLGYATAEDRAFQMTYTLRVIQGRLSEVVGEVRHLSRNESSVDNDRKMRTFGFYQAAIETAAKLDPETRALLVAYTAGVNAYFAEQVSGPRIGSIERTASRGAFSRRFIRMLSPQQENGTEATLCQCSLSHPTPAWPDRPRA
jgi:penicillin amidase